MEQVLARLGEEYRAAGRAPLFEKLKQTLTDEPDQPSKAEIALGMSMSENAVKQAFYRLRQRYRLLLREEIAHTVAVPGDVEASCDISSLYCKRKTDDPPNTPNDAKRTSA